jgi:hypothetical protein
MLLLNARHAHGQIEHVLNSAIDFLYFVIGTNIGFFKFHIIALFLLLGWSF